MRCVLCFLALSLLGASPTTSPTSQPANQPKSIVLQAAVDECRAALTTAKTNDIEALEKTTDYRAAFAHMNQTKHTLEVARQTGSTEDKVSASADYNHARQIVESMRKKALASDAELQTLAVRLSQRQAALQAELFVEDTVKLKAAADAKKQCQILEDYIRRNNAPQDIADRMRIFDPAVGMTEDELDAMVHAQNEMAGCCISLKKEAIETPRERAFDYIFFRSYDGNTTPIKHRISIVDGRAVEVIVLGSGADEVSTVSVVAPRLSDYIRDQTAAQYEKKRAK